jgi:parvulin-like peptidyl-prolyl isomerase
VVHSRTSLAQCAFALAAFVAAAQPRAAEPPLPADTFAVVGTVTLTAADYRATFSSAARDKFYHSKPPEAEIAAYQREVGDDLVNRVLVVEEAKRRGIKPDAEQVKQRLARYEARSKHSPNWDKERARLLESMTVQFENQSRYEQYEAQARKVPEPTEAQARAYYEAHKDLFREPEKLRLSVILLKVDPGAPKAAWNKARDEAAALRKRIVSGEDFAALARRQSGDPTAKDGGDMGYLHRGMLPDGVDKVADALKASEVSEPVTLLEGVALLKLNERKAAQQRSFQEVRERAGDLWQREEGDRRWKALIADLRKATPVRINESLYMPLPKPAAPKAG